MSISIIVPVHCKAPRLKLMLAGILGQDNINDCELIIVADNPTAAVREVITAAAAQLDYVIETPAARLGRAGARNKGAEHASGALLLFIDDDILVKPDFVLSHVSAQAKQPGLVHGSLRELIGLLRVEDPGCGGPACPPIDIEDLRTGRWQPGSARLITNPLEQAAEHPAAAAWPWLVAAGANISVPRQVWRDIGGFDATYGTRWGMEDIDFAYRLWRSGVPVSLAPDALGYHMSHYQADRWEDHHENLQKFQQLAVCPEALALGELLSPGGSVDRYIQRVNQIRQTGLVPAP